MAVHPASESGRFRSGTLPARSRRAGTRPLRAAAHRGRGHQRQGVVRRVPGSHAGRGRAARRGLYVTAPRPLQRTGEDRGAGGLRRGAGRGVRARGCGARGRLPHLLRVRNPRGGGPHRAGAGRRRGDGGGSRRPAGRGQRLRAERIAHHRDRRRSPRVARRRSGVGRPRESRDHAPGRALRHRRALAAGERPRPRAHDRHAVPDPRARLRFRSRRARIETLLAMVGFRARPRRPAATGAAREAPDRQRRGLCGSTRHPVAASPP